MVRACFWGMALGLILAFGVGLAGLKWQIAPTIVVHWLFHSDSHRWTRLG